MGRWLKCLLQPKVIGSVGLVSILALSVGDVLGHSGGTNAAGCHTNRRTGDYHCHTPKASVPDRVNYCHVINGEYRCGYARSTCNTLVNRFGGYCARK